MKNTLSTAFLAALVAIAYVSALAIVCAIVFKPVWMACKFLWHLY